MDPGFLLGFVVIIFVLAFPIVAVVALGKALDGQKRARRLQTSIGLLEARQHQVAVATELLQQRVTILEARQSQAPAVSKPLQESAVTESFEVAERVSPAAETSQLTPENLWRESSMEVQAPIRTSRKKPTQGDITVPVSSPVVENTIEKSFGTKWAVWIGGIALALGAVFLVRYSVELIGPGVRIILAGIFSALLIMAGEWTRRKEVTAGILPIPTRHIPSILTAAGTIAAYSTVYAAFALYGFLSPLAAFILLGFVALFTLAAALLHGPALAGLGLAGAFIAPLLVPSDPPDYWALYIYLAAVTAAAFALARIRLWRWLAITAVVFGGLWTLPGVETAHVAALAAHLFHVAVGFILAASLIVSGLLFGPTAQPEEIDGISSGAISTYLLAAAVLVIGSVHDPFALTEFTILAAATIGIAWRVTSALWALAAVGVMSILVMLHWAMPTNVESLLFAPGVTAGAIPGPPSGATSHLSLGLTLATLFGAAGFAAQWRHDNPLVALVWSITAVITPIAILITLYMRIAEFDRSIPFAGLALLLAALYGYGTALLSKRPRRPGGAAKAAIFAVGSVSSLALALTFALDKGWLTIGLALMVPGIAWISERRPLPALRYLATMVILLVLLRVAYEPRIVGTDVGTTPLFNWLLYGYGVPAASFWYAGYKLRQRKDDLPARTADAAAILFTVLLVFLEIRHYVNNGDVYFGSSSLEELAMQISSGLAITIGLLWLAPRTKSVVHAISGRLLGILTMAAIVIGLAALKNPLITGEPVGGKFFNLILLGYGIPAILAGILAFVTRKNRSPIFSTAAAAFAVGLTVFYLGLEVRTAFHGSILTVGITHDIEQYTYSTVWLTFGVLLLLAGFLLKSRAARMASAAVVAFTIAKVFFIDMAGLTGILRALSFIGLGVVLIGIGFFYQRILFPVTGSVRDAQAPTASR